MNQMNYAYLDQAYTQTNLINENKINIKNVEKSKKSNWFNRIGNFFRSLCCCFAKNNDDDKNENNNNDDVKSDDKTIVEINLKEIIEPNLFKIKESLILNNLSS